jgi:hypothetical protein
LERAGDLRIYAITGAMSQPRWFCGDCGTTLFWKVDALPDLTGIAGGCFVETPLGEPSFTCPIMVTALGCRCR